MPEDRIRDRDNDLILPPRTYALVLDETKGRVSVLVGPTKASVGGTERLVIYDLLSREFKPVSRDQAVTTWKFAPEGSYMVLTNPATKPDEEHPKPNMSNDPVGLDYGRVICIPGPATFALWPEQSVEVIEGHRLRTNQYLIVEVVDDEAAKLNWQKGVMKRQTAKSANEGTPTTPAGEGDPVSVISGEGVPELTRGQRLIIRGTEFAFYMPPTGVSVVQDEYGNYVREAVTLERLEYCILLNEDGNKRYVYGPDVVFPNPEEEFIKDGYDRKFKAIQLTPISGIHILVTADYKENDGTSRKAGEELFITGTKQSIYAPRAEHAIISYPSKDGKEEHIHYGVAIPAGEGRYVLDRLSGIIDLIMGPRILLPDPRTQVVVRRILSEREVTLMYPGNKEALTYNQGLAAMMRPGTSTEYIQEREFQKTLRGTEESIRAFATRGATRGAEEKFVGDEISRRTSFTPPRTIVLDTKYDGAVTLNIWPEYAVLIVAKSGTRRVEIGPKTVLLQYDESLMPMTLSTGTPKNDDRTMSIDYLKTRNNLISDEVEAETGDLCQVKIRLSYRVNFEGDDPEKWFSADNYVKLLTDHLRSLIRGVVKQYGIQEFSAKAVPIIRDAILGKEGARTGKIFTENNMRVYDVEILGQNTGNREIALLLEEAQHAAVKDTLAIASEKRELDAVLRKEEFNRTAAGARAETTQLLYEQKIVEARKELALKLAQLAVTTDAEKASKDADLTLQDTLAKIHEAEQERQKVTDDLEYENSAREQKLRVEMLAADVDAVVKKYTAMTPDLIAALQAFGDKDFVAKVVQALEPLTTMKQMSTEDALKGIFPGLKLNGAFANFDLTGPGAKKS